MSGTLFIVGTPIGNREDISLRALATLWSADIILCEDTRVTGKLLELYPRNLLRQVYELHEDRFLQEDERIWEEKPELVRLDEQTERRKLHQVLQWLEQSKKVALVSDSGMPTISDPGFITVRATRERDIQIQVVPGPTALSAAVATAGLPPDQVLFLGFLPRKAGKRKSIWEQLTAMRKEGVITPTVALYESPFRLRKTVEEVAKNLDNPEVALVGELTKVHEKVLRGSAQDVLEELPEKPKGEWVVLIRL